MQNLNGNRAIVRLFGQLEVWGRTGQSVEFLSEKSKQLLAFLALEKRAPVKRDVLIASLWTKGEEERLRHNLSTELWRLRRALLDAGEDDSKWIFARAESLSLCQNEDIWIDIEAVDCALETASANNATSHLVEQLAGVEALYRRDLLSGLFEDWCLLYRETYRRRFLAILEILLNEAKHRADWREAIRISRRMLAEDSFSEQTHREVMYCLAMVGERAAALRHYETLRRDLQRELGVSPTQDTTALFHSIRNDGLQSRVLESLVPTAPHELEGRLQLIERHLQQLAKDIGDLALIVRPKQPN